MYLIVKIMYIAVYVTHSSSHYITVGIYSIWLFWDKLMAHRVLHRHLKINLLIFLVTNNENSSHIGTGHVIKGNMKGV